MRSQATFKPGKRIHTDSIRFFDFRLPERCGRGAAKSREA
jgi:hypothetical protein